MHPLRDMSLEAKLAYLGVLAFGAMADDGELQAQEKERILTKAASLDVRNSEFEETVEMIVGLKSKIEYLKEALQLVKKQEISWYLVCDFLDVMEADGQLTESGLKLLVGIEKILGLSKGECDFLKKYFDYVHSEKRGGYKEVRAFFKDRPRPKFDMERFLGWFTPELKQMRLAEAKGLCSFSNARYIVESPYVIDTLYSCSFKDCELAFVANGSIDVNHSDGIDVTGSDFWLDGDSSTRNYLFLVKDNSSKVNVENSVFSGNGKVSALAVCGGANDGKQLLRVINTTFANLRKDKCPAIYLQHGTLWIEACKFNECHSPNANLVISGNHLNIFASEFSNCTADMNLLCWEGVYGQINVIHNFFVKCAVKLNVVGYWGNVPQMVKKGSVFSEPQYGGYATGLGIIDCCQDQCHMAGIWEKRSSEYCRLQYLCPPNGRRLSDEWVKKEDLDNVRNEKGQVCAFEYPDKRFFSLYSPYAYVRWKLNEKTDLFFGAESPEGMKNARFLISQNGYLEIVAHKQTEIANCIFVDTAIKCERCLENRNLLQGKMGVSPKAMLTFKNCTFSGNFVRSAFFFSQDVLLDHCTIRDFTCLGDGNAVFGTSNDKSSLHLLIAKDCLFENLESGNVACAWGMDITMERCRFVRCSSRKASIVCGFKVVLNDCMFEECRVNGTTPLVARSVMEGKPLLGSQISNCRAIKCNAHSVQADCFEGSTWEVVN